MDRNDSNASGRAGSAAVATPWWRGARGRVALLGAAVLLLAASYAAMGFLWAPAAVERGLTRTAATAMRSALSIGKVHVDPFRMVVVLDDVRVSAADADEMLTVERVEYRLRVRSLLGARPVLDRLVLAQPQMMLGTDRPAGSPPGGLMPLRMLVALLDAEPFRVEHLHVFDGEVQLRRGVAGNEHVEVYAGISLTARSIDSGDAAVPAHYLLEIEETPAGRLMLEGAARVRSATTGQPALEVLSGHGAAQSLDLQVAPGLALRASDTGIEGLVGTLSLPGGRLQAVARLRMHEALLRDEDAVALALSQLEGTFDVGSSAHAGGELHLEGQTALAGRFSLSSSYMTAGAPPATTLRLHDVAAEPLSLMLEHVVGRRVSAGLATIALQTAADEFGAGQTLTLDVLASNLALAPEPQLDAADAGFDTELFLALLEDPRGQVGFAVPVPMRPSVSASTAFTQALRAYARETVAAPAAALGRAVELPGPPPMILGFEPGAAALTQAATEALSELAAALVLRPRLGVAVPARIDPQLDRDALARQQVELHVTLATAGAAFRARPQPVDFASVRAQSVLDEFAGERLPADVLAAIAAQHERSGEPQARAPYYRAVFAALVERERIERGALERIGRYRARSIADALVGLGLPSASVEVAEDVTSVSSDAGHSRVPVELRLRAHSAQ